MKSSSFRRQCQATIHRTGAARTVAAALALGVMCGGMAWGQQNVYSRDSYNGNLWWANENPWFYSDDGGNQNRPDNNFDNTTRHNVFIGHNNNTTMTVNGAFFGLRTLTIENTATSTRTFNASDGEGIGLSVGFTNASTAGDQTFNVPIGVDASNVTFEVTNSGRSTNFTSDFFLNANTATFQGAGNITLSGTASGANGAITKTGSGTLTLSASNSYTGATAVNAGTLVVGVGGVGSITSNVTVNDGGTLGGSGTITGSVTVNDGGTHNAGNSPGIQTVNGNVTYNAGSIFEWDLNGNTITQPGSAPYAFDQVKASGTGHTLTVSDTVDTGAIFRIVLGTGVDLDDSFWSTAFTTQTWNNIFTDFDTLVGGFHTSNIEVTGKSIAGYGSFSISGTTLTWAAIPEPSTALAGLLLAAGLLRRRRS